MKNLFRLILAISFLVAATNVYALEKCNATFADKIISCDKSYTCEYKKDDKIVQQAILGKNSNGTCGFSAGVKGSNGQTCNFSDASVKALANMSKYMFIDGFVISDIKDQTEYKNFRNSEKVLGTAMKSECGKTPPRPKKTASLPDCDINFSSKISSCIKNYACKMKHPFMQDFKIKHIIVNKNEDGTCKVFQTMPSPSGKGGKLCNYSKEPLMAFSRVIKKHFEGESFDISVKFNLKNDDVKVSSSDKDNEILNSVINTECIITGFE